LNHRGLVAAILVLSLLLAAYSARTIRVRFQFRDFYDYAQNPRLPLFKQDLREFGDLGGNIIAVVDSGDVFQPAVLEYVQSLTQALEANPMFARVRSLSNTQAIRGKGDEVVTGPLLSPIPKDAQSLQDIRTFALSSPTLRRSLVSADGKTTAVFAQMRVPAVFSSVVEERAAIAAVQGAVSRTPAPVGTQGHVTGAPIVDVAVTESLVRDQLVLTPAVLAVLSLVLLITFRSLHGIVLCLSAVSVAAIWTAGLFAQGHRPVDLVGSLIPTTLLVYSVVDPIFVLTRVLGKLEAGLEKHDAIVEAFSELALPCFLTSLTTALGFAAFVTARQATIQYYGATVAVGVLLAWLTTITVLPLLISVVPLPKRRFVEFASSRWIDAGLQFVWQGLRGRIPQTIAVTGVVLVLGAWFGSKQRIDNVYVDEVPAGETRSAVRRLEQRLAGVVPLTVYLQGAPGDMKRPEVLKRIEGIQRAIEKQPIVTLTSSLADLVSEANQAFHGGEPESRRVPSSRGLITQYLALVDPTSRAAFVTEDYARAHILTLLVDAGSEQMRAIAARLQHAVDAAAFDALGIQANLTGAAIVSYGEFDDVVRQLLLGFVWAFGTIVLLQWLVFRSLRIALISVVPNLLPVIACFIALRIFGMQLKIDTALVLCISVGGLFNTTIHFAARTRQLVEAGERDPDAVIGRAMRAVGPPALFTALALSVGFSVLLLSSFPGLRALGLLSMVTLTIGFFSDMIVTAVLLRVGFDWNGRIGRVAPELRGAVVTGPPAVRREREEI
jgi:predicted RND superfamily exporter protein